MGLLRRPFVLLMFFLMNFFSLASQAGGVEYISVSAISEAGLKGINKDAEKNIFDCFGKEAMIHDHERLAGLNNITDSSHHSIDSGGIWIDKKDLINNSTCGPAWEVLYRDAERDPGIANISDQDSNHDVYTLASALVCVRTGRFCAKAKAGVVSAIDTERGARWLAVGRNLTAYIIAADLLDLRADSDPVSDGSRVGNWLKGFFTRPLAQNIKGKPIHFPVFSSGSNASAQEGAAFIALAAYLKDRKALNRGWQAYRTFVCDPGAPDFELINLHKGDWSYDDRNPCAINPAGSKKVVPPGLPGAGLEIEISGAIINDMRRGGEFQWPPIYTQYPWVGLEGLVPAALMLYRAGYPAFDIADRAILRTHEFLWKLRQTTGEERWFDGERADEIIYLVNQLYGTRFPIKSATGRGRTVGYTDWSHQKMDALGNGVAALGPDIALIPASHDYAGVAVGGKATYSFKVSNAGNAELTVMAIGIEGDDEYRIDDGGAPFTLAPGTSRKISVSFNPTTAGSKTASLRIFSNDPNENPLDLSLTGTAAYGGEALIVLPTDDARVSYGFPSKNYGSSDVLRVRSAASHSHESYLKFSVTGLKKSPKSAVLRLFVINGSPDGGNVYLVENQWDEVTLSASNAPVIGGSPVASVGRVKTDTLIKVDVSAIVRGNGIYSFGIRNSSPNSVLYSTKEGVIPPELVIQ